MGLPFENKPKKHPDKITCLACGKEKNINAFYKNRDSYKTRGLDIWCKDCASSFVNSKETMEQYCKYNNRVFSDTLWEKGYSLALSDIENGKVSDIDSEIAKNLFAIKKAIKYYFMQMSLNRWYEYKEYDKPIPKIHIKEKKDTQETIVENISYSEFWEGYYSDEELEKLNRKYNEYESDFDIPDVHTKDMFKKIVKISYMQDNAMMDVQKNPTKENIDSLDKISKMMNTMSDSMKLNLSKRTANDKGGFTDLGSLIARIESTGALLRKQEFEKDDVDYAISEYIRGATSSLIDENLDVLVDDIEQDGGDILGS